MAFGEDSMIERKLHGGDRRVIKLIARDRDDEGWATVTATLLRVIRDAVPAALVVFEETENGGRARLTDEGEAVARAMPWL